MQETSPYNMKINQFLSSMPEVQSILQKKPAQQY